MDEQQQGEAPADNTDAWGELAGRLEDVLGAEQGGVGAGGGVVGGAGGEIAPQGLPVLDRLAQLTERLEATLAGGQEAPYNPVAGPARAPRAEDILPGPTAFPGQANPSAAFHGGAPFGIDQEAMPLPQAPPFAMPEQPLYTGLQGPPVTAGEWAAGAPAAAASAWPVSPGMAAAEVPAFEMPAAPPWGELPGLTVPGVPAAAAPETAARAGAPQMQAPVPGAAITAPAAPAFAFDFAPPAPAWGELPGVGGAGAPAGQVPEMPGGGASAPPFAGGEFHAAGPPPYAGHAGLFASGADAPDYPALPMAEGGVPEAGGRGEGGGEKEGGGALGELRGAIDELRAAVQGLQGGGQKGRGERRPGPQRDGSFVPGGPGLIGGMFGDFPRDYERE